MGQLPPAVWTTSPGPVLALPLTGGCTPLGAWQLSDLLIGHSRAGTEVANGLWVAGGVSSTGAGDVLSGMSQYPVEVPWKRLYVPWTSQLQGPQSLCLSHPAQTSSETVRPGTYRSGFSMSLSQGGRSLQTNLFPGWTLFWSSPQAQLDRYKLRRVVCLALIKTPPVLKLVHAPCRSVLSFGHPLTFIPKARAALSRPVHTQVLPVSAARGRGSHVQEQAEKGGHSQTPSWGKWESFPKRARRSVPAHGCHLVFNVPMYVVFTFI